jgi:phosphatidylserine/phosphatidylglycerophosphate/cardiolipin synthase-like enzyme
MAAKPLTLPNSQDPPERLVTRTAQIGLGVANTLRVPGDAFSDDTNAWFASGAGLPLLRQDNQVKYMIDGSETFREMAAVIRTATGAGHFIYLSNWWVDDGFELLIDEPGMNLRTLLAQASTDGVMVRAMFWDQQFSLQNNAEASRINALPNGAAIVDARGNEEIPILEDIIPFHYGSQHQKILCVMGEHGLVTFCGGIDFNPDRIQSSGHGAPLHDVHCRIRGPAAADVLQTFIQRWNDHVDGQRHNRPRNQGGKGPLIVLNQLPASAGPQVVQIGRTFGRSNYGFAPHGETTAREMIRRAIRNAKRYIYTEDQYFVGNPEVQADLIHALQQNHIRHLTILLTHWRISDLPLVQRHRREFIGALRRAGGDRVRVFALRPQGSNDQEFAGGRIAHTYIHAKIWIIDDEFAAIGSVNTNRRSWSHDNEIVAGIYDTSNDNILTYRLAHWLRIELWKEHLNLQTVEGNAELSDGVASAIHWLKPPAGARVQPYNENEAGDQHIPVPIIGLPLELLLYDSVIDPA